MRKPTVRERRTGIDPAGRRKAAATALLEQGANLLQSTAPLRGFDVYVVGFHCAKDRPDLQMEAHHYCRVVNEDFLQCVLFDGNTKDANLIGIEYIVSGRLFDRLLEAEQPSWHPHNYEILSGQLAAPGLPAAAEKAFLRRLVNSYGKTWHTWHSFGQDATDLPLGPPMLMWSFNRDGECDAVLHQDRDRAMGLDTAARREHRRSLVGLARPQCGVDAMADQFDGTAPIEGVRDRQSSPVQHPNTSEATS